MAIEKVKKVNVDNVNIGINPKNRKEVVELLEKQLSDTYILQLKTKYYHWNVTGSNFFSLHTLFDTQYAQLAEAVDELAERIRSLGFSTPGTFHEFLELADLGEDKSLPASWQDMVTNLVAAHEHLAKTTRDKISASQKDGDEGTADLFIKRLQEHEKAAWFLRSHL